MTAFRHDTLSLDYHDSGSGPLTLVLLPGWCEPKTVFDPFIALAEQQYRVISLDWRGHGLSGRDATLSLDAEDLLADLRQLLLELRVERFVTLSVAHASWIAVALAESLSPRAQGMVFLDWIMTQPEPAFFDSVQQMQWPEKWLSARDTLFDFWQGGIEQPQVKHHLTVEMAQEDFRVWQAAGVAIEQAYRQYSSPLNRLSELSSPPACRHIYSLDRDEDYLRQQQVFAANHPFFSVARLEHARTHLGILEQPEAVYREVVNFLDN
ncbi:alpha/beta hydrolase [Serratia quinivorans]|uniref:alpha/beta hydrolase n=1 Tax=Serratia quinivorans TaxID=137545 RepID=UPI00217A0A59|nr:alpha/beta hydrolase [Serratia quinivorans]CAI0786292.1 haloalkane dehalogenase [Serratia quinivorans]CAI0790115.1 haloalkane dehalogenase [Serratia quinivorans]CAI0812056.1 haloalkane dehalogenase [Serratia quinivorans]CAI1720979.1 haloalkane dehalogenase [Serratia quinivorans]CAI2064519.1 haloalkane dehalogenase [Serratia quinivorans]